MKRFTEIFMWTALALSVGFFTGMTVLFHTELFFWFSVGMYVALSIISHFIKRLIALIKGENK